MSSKIKVDNINKVSDDSNIIKKCGTTITLGASGDSIALATGASQTGFGRTGTVDWVTTIKTNSDSPITAVSGKGYFLNTTSGTITINFPSSPSAGDIVSIKDYARTFGTNAVTVGRGGSNMDGTAADSTLSTNGLSVTFIYMDATKGWSLINDDTTSQVGAGYVTATGGTISTCGDYKIHKFTGPGTFCVSCAGNPAGSSSVDYLVVAGGGSGAANGGSYDGTGAGGAGGLRESHSTPVSGPYTATPLATPTAISISVQGYPIVIGAGATGAPATPASGSQKAGPRGSNSSFSTITSTGGGGGNYGTPSAAPEGTGGSGGGAGGTSAPPGGCGAAGNTPPVSPSQGNPGGDGANTGPSAGGGGGGATAAGGDAASPGNAGDGGAGGTTSISGSPTAYAGGGGGGSYNPNGNGGAGGTGGGGNGGNGGGNPSDTAVNGTVNTGGGGGSPASAPSGIAGGSGGSGIVIIRYRFQ